MAPFRAVQDIPAETLRGRRIFVRADFNVPLGDDATVSEHEAWRIHAGMETLRFLSEHGARVVVGSHLGRSGESLKPVADYINGVLGFDIGFVPAVTGDIVHDVVSELPYGGVVLLENLRQHPGEKANDQSFAEELSTYAEWYVNDAFPASHREHASIVALAKLLPAYAGIQFAKEYENLEQARIPDSPSLLILAGAKFGTKLALLESYLPKIDRAFVGGALANNFFRAMGHAVGDSLVDDAADIAHLVGNPKVLIPRDVIVADIEQMHQIRNPLGGIQEGDVVADAGPATTADLIAAAQQSRTIIWNGPLGNYEAGFAEETVKLAQVLASVDAQVYVGGGDTVAVLLEHNLMDGFTFVSTAGGAMLDFLVDGKLPGLEVLIP